MKAVEQKSNNLADEARGVDMELSLAKLLAIFCFTILPIVLGCISLWRIDNSPNGILYGRFFAWGAIVLGIIWCFTIPFMSYSKLRSSGTVDDVYDRVNTIEVGVPKPTVSSPLEKSSAVQRSGVSKGADGKADPGSKPFVTPQKAPHEMDF
jgi:hypothetical protein